MDIDEIKRVQGHVYSDEKRHSSTRTPITSRVQVRNQSEAALHYASVLPVISCSLFPASESQLFLTEPLSKTHCCFILSSCPFLNALLMHAPLSCASPSPMITSAFAGNFPLALTSLHSARGLAGYDRLHL